MSHLRRESVVNGKFYPADKNELQEMIQSFYNDIATNDNVVATVSPHAGYVYSGKIAAKVLSLFSQKDVFIILAPNHTGLGPDLSISSASSWETPLGSIDIDKELTDQLCEKSQYFTKDSMAHRFEHSIEVQLPFLQVFQKESFSILPICIKGLTSDMLTDIVNALAFSITSSSKRIGIIASNDMTHFEEQTLATEKDKLVLESILSINPKEMMQKVNEHQISMCGYLPVMLLLSLLNDLKITNAELVEYSTSGDVCGDFSSVVGYAGVAFRKNLKK